MHQKILSDVEKETQKRKLDRERKRQKIRGRYIGDRCEKDERDCRIIKRVRERRKIYLKIQKERTERKERKLKRRAKQKSQELGIRSNAYQTL